MRYPSSHLHCPSGWAFQSERALPLLEKESARLPARSWQRPHGNTCFVQAVHEQGVRLSLRAYSPFRSLRSVARRVGIESKCGYVKEKSKYYTVVSCRIRLNREHSRT